MDNEAYIVPQYLDHPETFAWWTKDEAGLLGGGFMLGVYFGFPFTGLVVGVVSWRVLKRVKSWGGARVARSLLYWLAPPQFQALRAVPPSACRRYFG